MRTYGIPIAVKYTRLTAFDKLLFPQPEGGFVKAKRAPVLFRPIIGSLEQLVIGSIAVSETSAFLARANRLERLTCFYGQQAAGAIFAIELSLDELVADLAVDPLCATNGYIPATSGVTIGSFQDVEGVSLEAIATSWLAGMSSLYAMSQIEQIYLSEASLVEDAPVGERAADRLSQLLLDYVSERQPGLMGAFSEEIRTQTIRRRGNAHKVFIDFSGGRIVANFGMLSTTGYAASVDRVKRRMWDLKIARDSERESFFRRDHEMIVQHPAQNDPQLSQKQVDKIMESIRDLEQQADQEEIRFRPLTSVEQIGDHLLAKEAA